MLLLLEEEVIKRNGESAARLPTTDLLSFILDANISSSSGKTYSRSTAILFFFFLRSEIHRNGCPKNGENPEDEGKLGLNTQQQQLCSLAFKSSTLEDPRVILLCKE